MTMIDNNISRRGVLAGLGGMSFCLALGVDGVSLVPEAQANALANAQVTPWVRIAPDGTVTIYSAGAEMGQGSMTSLALILAEELDADWSKVKIEFAPADADIYGYTFQNQKMMAIVGSRAVQLYYANLRTAGAQVRKVLLANAAEKWGVDAASLKTEPGAVINPANGQRLSYGEIAAFGKIPATLPAVDPKELKARKDFRLIGKTIPRHDTPSKVNGSAVYAIDVRLPGMVYATALHSPVHTGEPESWNDADIKKMPGVIGTVRLSERHRHRRRAFRAGDGCAERAQGQVEGRQRGGIRLRPRARGLRPRPSRSEGADHEPGDEGRRQGGLRRRRQDAQGGVPQRLRLSRADGAAERGGAHQRRRHRRRGVGRQPGARRHPRRGGQGARPQARPGHDAPVLHGRRLRPALARRLRRRVRAHRQGGAPPGQADMDTRGGHRPRHVPPAVVPVPGGGAGRDRQGRRAGSIA